MYIKCVYLSLPDYKGRKSNIRYRRDPVRHHVLTVSGRKNNKKATAEKS